MEKCFFFTNLAERLKYYIFGLDKRTAFCQGWEFDITIRDRIFYIMLFCIVYPTVYELQFFELFPKWIIKCNVSGLFKERMK